ncbi:MAG: hypothetical protein JW863_02200 [Chitinispirillaceae bacterium]|nr:hypothetical protein [Chitinispirillaceae bacterium]
MNTGKSVGRNAMVVSAVALSMLLPGCRCVEDLLSWTPFWWLVNRPVQQSGSLHRTTPVIQTRNYIDAGKHYSYRLLGGKIEYRNEGNRWRTLPNGNPRDCGGETLEVKLMAADNNRLFVVAQDRRGKRSLWWYCVKDDQAEWSKTLVDLAGDLMKKGYPQWIACAHKGGSWTNLLAMREFVPYKRVRFRKTGIDSAGKPVLKPEAFDVPRASIDVDDVVDIAVGNWTGTVVTYYVLMGSTGKIMYIDEEVVMDRWKTVPHLCLPCNDPYPLDSNSRIAASNSVICAYKTGSEGALVSWIRWDFHNRQDFSWYPLDWCEHRWHSVVCPLDSAEFLCFDTHWPDSVRDSIWERPKNVADGRRTGFLGTVDKRSISAYRVEITVFQGKRMAKLELDTLDYKKEKTLDDSVWKVSVATER